MNGMHTEFFVNASPAEGGIEDFVTNSKKFIPINKIEHLIPELQLRVRYSDIVDNLSTDDSQKPLSARQGKYLYTQIESCLQNVKNLSLQNELIQKNIDTVSLLVNQKADASSVIKRSEVHQLLSQYLLKNDAESKYATIEHVNEQLGSKVNVDVFETAINDSTITRQGNNFNDAGQLVQLDEAGRLPAVDGSQLRNLKVEIDSSGLYDYQGEGEPDFIPDKEICTYLDIANGDLYIYKNAWKRLESSIVVEPSLSDIEFLRKRKLQEIDDEFKKILDTGFEEFDVVYNFSPDFIQELEFVLHKLNRGTTFITAGSVKTKIPLKNGKMIEISASKLSKLIDDMKYTYAILVEKKWNYISRAKQARTSAELSFGVEYV